MSLSCCVLLPWCCICHLCDSLSISCCLTAVYLNTLMLSMSWLSVLLFLSCCFLFVSFYLYAIVFVSVLLLLLSVYLSILLLSVWISCCYLPICPSVTVFLSTGLSKVLGVSLAGGQVSWASRGWGERLCSLLLRWRCLLAPLAHPSCFWPQGAKVSVDPLGHQLFPLESCHPCFSQYTWHWQNTVVP